MNLFKNLRHTILLDILKWRRLKFPKPYGMNTSLFRQIRGVAPTTFIVKLDKIVQESR
jgi:hypothetical protein